MGTTQPVDPFDEHTIPATSRRRELADRVETLWFYHAHWIVWTVAAALFLIFLAVLGSRTVAGAPAPDHPFPLSGGAGTVTQPAPLPSPGGVGWVATTAERVTEHAHPGPPWAVLEGCDLAEWHANAAGLPVPLFRDIAEAESGCRNDITNRYGRPCCHGVWQIHQLWLRDPVVQACGATDVASLRTDTPVSWAVNACAAARILEVQGVRAWQVCTKRIVRC